MFRSSNLIHNAEIFPCFYAVTGSVVNNKQPLPNNQRVFVWYWLPLSPVPSSRWSPMITSQTLWRIYSIFVHCLALTFWFVCSDGICSFSRMRVCGPNMDFSPQAFRFSVNVFFSLLPNVFWFLWSSFALCSLCSFFPSAEVENAKRGLEGGQAYNISTVHPLWNPLCHPLCHSQCHPLR